MLEKRKEPRVEAETNITVYDANTSEYLGQLVNLSNEGMMLICPVPIEQGLIFQLELVLNPPHHSHKTLHCGVESLWSSSANQKKYHWAGLHIIDISLEEAETIEGLLQTWKAKRAAKKRSVQDLNPF